MQTGAIPENENERIARLRKYQILDSEEEKDFDDIVALASQLCDAPIALITLVDEHRQWFKAKVGLSINETHRDLAFCAHAIHDENILEIPDALKDERFYDNPLVKEDPKIRFYAGMPLITREGHKMGTLCVIDQIPRQLNDLQRTALRTLGRHVIHLMELRKINLEQSQLIDTKQNELYAVFERIHEGFIVLDKNWNYVYANQFIQTMVNRDPKELIGKNVWKEFPEAVGSATYVAFHQAMEERIIIRHIDHFASTDLWQENHIYPTTEGISVFIRDISFQKRAELRLRAKKERLERAEHQANLGSWQIEIATGTRIWSKQLFKIYERDPEKGVPDFETNLNRVHPEDRPLLVERYAKMMNGDLPDFEVFRTNPALLPLKYLLPTYTLIRDDNGKPLRYEGTVLDITQMKKAEADIQASEANYRAIFENSLDGIYQSTPDGKIITANSAVAKLFGYESVEEFMSSVTDLALQTYSDPSDRQEMINLLNKNGKVLGYEVKALTKTQEVIWLRCNTQVVYDSQGAVKYYEGTLRDVTERKKAQDQLLKEKELSDSIINSLPGVLYLYDTNGKFLRWNKNFETVTGYSGEEIAAMHPLQFFDEDEKELLTARIGEVFTRGFGEVEANFFLKNKRKIPYYFNGWKIEYENQTCLIGTGIDITKRKIAEERLRTSENKLKAFFRSTPDSSVLLGKEFEILAFNDAASELNKTTYGTDLHEGENFLDKIFPEVQPIIQEFFTKALKGETSVQEFPIPNRNTGNSIWWLAAFMPAYDDNGKIFGVVANSTNIDSIKRAKFKLQKQNEELKQTNFELDRFVYSVSHDLRAPLSSVLGLINIAEKEAPTASFSKYLSMMRTSINKLDGFIKDILDYSRNNRKSLEISSIDFDALMKGVASNFELIKGREHLQIHSQINCHIPFHSDFTRLAIVFNNIFSNAIKFQDYGKSNSYLSIKIDVDPKQAILEFLDNGIGIEPVHLDKVFTMFYRGTDQSNGSGLGLYIAKETVDKLGGSIEITSTAGVFTKLILQLPNTPIG